MTTFWIRLSVYTTTCEVEAANRKDLKIADKGMIKEKLLSLFSQGLPNSPDVDKYLKALIGKNRVSMQYDRYVSPHFGVRTSRVTFRVAKHNLFPSSVAIQPGEHNITEIGKRTEIGEVKLRANVIMKIVVAIMSESEMKVALKENPAWFCGELDP
ncbi:TPA_asm: M [Ocimum alphacytorhabdovirus 1]|nr:TPA_asm: M [Ocimum alphacytorhabdovirus 1]